MLSGFDIRQEQPFGFPEHIAYDIPAPDYTGKPTMMMPKAKIGDRYFDYKFDYKFENKMKKNNITTAGYFLNRLRDSGFIAIRSFADYSVADPRKWTMIVDPGGHSLFITCFINKEAQGEVHFEFNDGGNRFKNYNLKTQSMEIIITTLIEKGVPQKTEDSVYTSKVEVDG